MTHLTLTLTINYRGFNINCCNTMPYFILICQKRHSFQWPCDPQPRSRPQEVVKVYLGQLCLLLKRCKAWQICTNMIEKTVHKYMLNIKVSAMKDCYTNNKQTFCRAGQTVGWLFVQPAMNKYVDPFFTHMDDKKITDSKRKHISVAR